MDGLPVSRDLALDALTAFLQPKFAIIENRAAHHFSTSIFFIFFHPKNKTISRDIQRRSADRNRAIIRCGRAAEHKICPFGRLGQNWVIGSIRRVVCFFEHFLFGPGSDHVVTIC